MMEKHKKASTKNKRFIVPLTLLWLLCIVGCKNNQDPTVETYNKATVTDYFEQIFVRDGELVGVRQNPYDLYTITVAVTDFAMPYRIFSAITGVHVAVQDQYRAYFQTIDKSCTMSITGHITPSDGVYATMLVEIEGYPNVKRIIMVNTEILNDNNEIVTDAITGKPKKAY